MTPSRPWLGLLALVVLATAAGLPAQEALPLGHPDFVPSVDRPVMWLGDGSARYPGATPVTSWNVETGENIIWKAELPSWANATTIVVRDKVITVAEPCTVLCYSVANGELLWHDSSSLIDLELPAMEAAAAKRGWSIFNRMWSTAGRRSPDIDWDRNFDTYAQFLIDQGLAEQQETDPTKRGGNSTLFSFKVQRDNHPWSRWGFSPLTELGEFPSMPVSDGKHLWITAGFDQITCYQVDTGTIVWRIHEKAVPCTVNFSTASTLYTPAPLLVDGNLLTYRRRHYRLYEGGTGKLLWELPGHTEITGHRQYGTPTLLNLPLPDGSGEQTVLVDTMGWVIRVADGKLLRTDCGPLPAGDIERIRRREHRPEPVIMADIGGHSMIGDDQNDVVIFADYQTGGGGASTDKTYAVRLACDGSPDTITAELLWHLEGKKVEGLSDTEGTGLIHDGVYLPNSGNFGAFDVRTGKALARSSGGVSGYPSTILAGNHLFMGNNAGTISVIDRQTLQVVSQQTLGWSDWKSEEAAGKRQALRTEMGERALKAVEAGILAWLPGVNSHKATYCGTGVVYGNPPTFQGNRMYIRTYTTLWCIGPKR